MKYLIIGYYGHKNLGDEAILRSLVLHIFKNDAKAKITAFTSDIKNSKEANPDIKIRFLRLNKNLFRLIAQTVRANRIIFPGGHIITSNSIKIYAIYALLGKLFFNKVFLLPSGISPIKGGVNKVAAKLFYALLHTHATRDYNSQKVLKESVNIKTKVLPDITILLKKIENKNQFNSTVGINLRYYGKEKCLDYEKIITIIKNLNKTGNTDFVLFSSSVDESQNDYLIINEFVKTMKEIGFKYSIVYPKNVIELLDLLRKMEFVVCTRLHVLLLGLNQGSIPIGISDNEFWKIDEVLHYFELDELLIKDNMELITTIVNQRIFIHNKISKILCKREEELKEHLNQIFVYA